MSDQELAEKQRILAERQAQLEALRQQRAQMDQQGGGGGQPQHHHHHHHQQLQQYQQQQSWGYAPHTHHHQHQQQQPQYHQHRHHHHHHAQSYQQHGGGGGNWQPGKPQWGQQQQPHQHQHGGRGGGGGGGGQQHPKTVYAEEYDDEDEFDDEDLGEDYDEFDDYVFAPEGDAAGSAAAPVGPDVEFEDMMAEAEAAASHRATTAAAGGAVELDSDEVFAMCKNPDATKGRTLAEYAAAGRLKSLRDNNGRTVLHYVAESRNAALAKQLVDAAAADGSVADDAGMTAADVSAICGDAAMCAVFGADPSQRGALLKKFRVAPPKFAAAKGAPAQKPKRRGNFWGSQPTPPDGSVSINASELGDASTGVPEVGNPAFVIPATPLDWTKPVGAFSPEYHARIHSLAVAARNTILATADVAPIGNLVVAGETLPSAAYAIGAVRSQRNGLRHLLNFTAGYLTGCVAGFVSPTDLSPILAPVCQIKWYQRSVDAMGALAGPSSRLLFPDVSRFYSVTRTDVLRKHDVAPEDAAATQWRVCADAASDGAAVAALLRAKSGEYQVTFDPSDEAVAHLTFGCNVVTLIRNDGTACATFTKRESMGHESLILAFTTATKAAEMDELCAAVRGLLPDVATVYASTLGLGDAALFGANFAFIDGSHQFFYVASSPAQAACAPVVASKVRFPVLF